MIPVVYEDECVLVADKPPGMVVFKESAQDANSPGPFLIDEVIRQRPELASAGSAPRYGAVHRLDKDTSGIVLIAKTNEALAFFQQQFKAHTASALTAEGPPLEKILEKRYIALVTGTLKTDSGEIKTFIGRSPKDPRKQKAYSIEGKHAKENGQRVAVTEYAVLERFAGYTLLEISLKTGRRHQIRCQLAYLHHPVAADNLYGFKDSPIPEGLQRQFLHASYVKIQLPDGQTREFTSPLPDDLKKALTAIREHDNENRKI